MNLFDLKGIQNGMPFGKKQLRGCLISFAILIVCLFLPISHVHPKAPVILGTVLFVIVSQVTGWLSIVQSILPVMFIWAVTGCVTYPEIMASIGQSPLLMMLGFFLVALGASHTIFARRLGYFLLSKFGKTPSLIILMIGLTTAIMSAFLSNLATSIMMATIAYEILQEMDEQPGKSNFGRCMMLSIPVFSCLGGGALLNGSPSSNVFGVAALAAATGTEITYGMWAAISLPISIILIIPTWFIYVKWFKVKESMSGKELDTLYFKNKLKELGGITGAEVRWIVIVLLMVVFLLLSPFPAPLVAAFFGAISILPIVGVAEKNAALKEMPIEIILGGVLFTVMGTLLSTSGVGTWAMNGLMGWALELPTVALLMIVGLIIFVLNSVLVNSQTAIITVSTAALGVLAAGNGMSPILLVMPTLLIYNARHVVGMQLDMLVTNGYGYWDQKDTFIPGIISGVLWVVVMVIGCLVLIPLYGW